MTKHIMTIWDGIYKNYQQGGEAWATLAKGLDQDFLDFVSATEFPTKCALDIGCGTGKYLKFLKEAGFEVRGIDSSETAVTMSKELLGGDSADVTLADMFEYEIPKEKFDLVYSIATIHHGIKSKVASAIGRIYEALLSGGYVFVTLPDATSGKNYWTTFKDKEEIEPGTYAPLSGPEKGLAHSFYDRQDVERMFERFVELKIELDDKGRWIINAKKHID